MRHRHQGTRRKVVALLVAGTAIVGPARVLAAWTVGGDGSSYGRATALAAPSAPTAALAGKGKVRVTWVDNGYGNGAAVGRFVVRRYDAATGVEATIHGGCAGFVGGTTCTDSNVPSGGWQYTDTPAPGSWRGAESGKSATLTVP